MSNLGAESDQPVSTLMSANRFGRFFGGGPVGSARQ